MELSIITIAPITTALVEVIKRTKGLSFLDGWYELLSLGIAVSLSIIGGLDILSGLVAGLAGMGLYDSVSKGITVVKGGDTNE